MKTEPTLEALRKRRDALGYLLEPEEVQFVMDWFTPPINLLVFGLGKDAPVWEEWNDGGLTVFVEDDPEWIARMSTKGRQIIQVDYSLKRSEWRNCIDNPNDMLAMALPLVLHSQSWSAIMVDGPAGNSDASPGRMQSIFAAAELSSDATKVFAHDINRECEQAYANRWLGRELGRCLRMGVFLGYNDHDHNPACSKPG